MVVIVQTNTAPLHYYCSRTIKNARIMYFSRTNWMLALGSTKKYFFVVFEIAAKNKL